jgi:hypothetical protein
MQAERNSSTILISLVSVLFVGYVVYSSLGLDKVSCEVCVEFRGESACRTASGVTREEAMRTATENACAQLVSGMTDSMDCSQTPPKSVSCQDR